MNLLKFPTLVVLVISLLLGVASAWPESGPPLVMLFAAHVAVIFLSLATFFLVLPRWLGQATQIFVAMAAGVVAGWLLDSLGQETLVAEYLGIFGRLFIDLLKMVIVPLVFISLTCGVAGIGDVRKLGSIGLKTLTYFGVTTAVAVLIGLGCVNLIRPGADREEMRSSQAVQEQVLDNGEANAAIETENLSIGMRIQKEVLPQFVEMPGITDQRILAVIFFALLLGAALAAGGDDAAAALRFFQAMDRAMIQIVHWIMLLAPIGVFSLMAKAVATMGIDYLVALAAYCLTVVLGLTLHFGFLATVMVGVIARVSPLRFLKGMAPAFQLAFSTSSSSATLPVTIDCATSRLGARKSIASFVLPLGATINMDGTALYQAVAALFIAQVYGLDLGLQQQLAVFFTAVIVSIGTAGIPGASVGMMAIVLKAAGIPIEGVGIVIGVDRVLDMCRTLVNVTGDAAGTMVVARSENAFEVE
jgi:Na+/H+-dicarboxylate symporter